ncbi:MAG TPA: response regulator [Propionibacteriaceae bacterium]|nr:response regulator [Propionibacteriaceae bacterium]HEX2857444.1 response regulator [Propionibacteriaceae bacterium]
MSADTTTDTLKVLLYSDDRTTRQAVRYALGRRIAADLPEIEVFDTATQPAVIHALETGHYDVVILDGEANPSGGFGIGYQLKDEIPDCPPVVLLVAREADAWLATWSRAEGVSSFPVDPIRLPRTVATVVRATRARR